MLRRHLLQSILALGLFSISGPGLAVEAGKDYEIVSPPQPGGAGAQIEVIEFFSFACPHCAAFEPRLERWARNLPKDVKLLRVPVSFRKEWIALGRLHFTLEAMGLSEKLTPAVFDAIHKERIALHEEKARNEWLAKQGVDVKKFNDAWKSFSVDSQMRRAAQLAEKYKVQGVPALYVDGKYLVKSPEERLTADQLHTRQLVTTDALIAKVRATKPRQ